MREVSLRHPATYWTPLAPRKPTTVAPLRGDRLLKARCLDRVRESRDGVELRIRVDRRVNPERLGLTNERVVGLGRLSDRRHLDRLVRVRRIALVLEVLQGALDER